MNGDKERFGIVKVIGWFGVPLLRTSWSWVRWRRVGVWELGNYRVWTRCLAIRREMGKGGDWNKLGIGSFVVTYITTWFLLLYLASCNQFTSNDMMKDFETTLAKSFEFLRLFHFLSQELGSKCRHNLNKMLTVTHEMVCFPLLSVCLILMLTRNLHLPISLSPFLSPLLLLEPFWTM